ncbi:hypothetical protein KO317_00790 [Candidatus Micrarchaeota archaeon]|nr:hypothetical protein [Candidatus Micrarchaeota archaeon]
MKKEIFILLLIISFIISFCPTGMKQIDVPAVVGGDDGGSLSIQIMIEPGEGNVYTSIFPKTGISTQTSEENAAISAFYISNKELSECTVYFDVINTLNSKYVDGPSAGASMAIAISAILDNKNIRNDAIITGTIDKNGNIGTVGGITEKAMAAAKTGKTYFITPIDSVRSKIIASSLEDLGKIQIINVNTLNEAKDIFFQPTGTKIERKVTPLKYTEIPNNLNVLNKTPDLVLFSEIGDKMAFEFEYNIKEYIDIVGINSSRYEFLEYFLEEIKIQRELSNKGYVFTSANNLFLQIIDFEFLTKLGDIDLETEKKETEECLQKFELNKKTETNWEWISGSEMRLNWAEDKLEGLPLFSEKTTEGAEYPYLYEILYAKSWCQIANYLNIPGSGKLINESNLEKFANDKIQLEQEFISRQPEVNSEALRHLRTAKQAFNKKQYITAIYDASFAHVLQQSSSDAFYEINLEKSSDVFFKSNKNLSGLWAQLYLTQAKYIYELGDKEGAYTIFLLSNEFESTNLKIIKNLELNEKIEETDKIEIMGKINYYNIILFLSALLVLESMLLIYFISKK